MIILYRHYDVNGTDYTTGIKDLEFVPFTDNYEKVINCICCEKMVKFGDCYTSRRYYSPSGTWGLWVCPECHKKNGKNNANMIEK